VRAKSLFASFLGSAALLAATHAFAIGEQYLQPSRIQVHRHRRRTERHHQWHAARTTFINGWAFPLRRRVTVAESVYRRVSTGTMLRRQEVFATPSK
jgi:hypothetical protein